MPTFTFTAPDGKKYTVNGPEGATEQQAFQMLQTQIGAQASAPAPAKPFGEQVNDFISDVPRVAGRTARAAIQGVGNTLDFAATPFRAALNTIPGVNIQAGSGQLVADSLGLPKPRPGMEAAADSGAEMLAGGMGFMKMAQGAGKVAQTSLAARAQQVASGTASNGRLAMAGQKLAQNTAPVAAAMGSNAGLQALSGGAAGLAGGYVRETGGNPTAQFAASLLAGIAAPMGAAKLQQAAGAAARAVKPAQVDPVQIEIQIQTALKGSGLTMDQLPANIQAGIRRDVMDAYQISGQLSPAAVRRLADYRLVGATPTAAGLTRDPAVFTQQANLAKMGINSKDTAAQQLGRTASDNNNALINNVNALGAAKATAPIDGGRRIMNALAGRDQTAKSLITARYEAARATNGRSAALDPYAFTQRANNLLDDALLGGKLPGDVRNLLNNAATGKMPLTVDVAEQFKTRIGDLQRATTDMAERKALGMVRQALDDTPLQPGQQMGQQSIDAFNKARQINRTWMTIVDKTPALKAVRDGMEPDKFVQQFITGAGGKANVADVKALHSSIKGNPDAVQAVREQIAGHLKAKALNGATDEVGALSQSAYNKALNEIGDEKLALFFKKAEIDQLKAVGRVASYEQKQPVGSSVNNSNTAGALMANVLDRLAGSSLMSKIPFGNALQQPAQNIVVGMKSRNSLNVPNALAAPRIAPARQGNRLMMSPALFATGEDR